MHEVGIIASTLEEVAVHARGREVAVVRLRVGTQTGVVAAALQHAWSALRPGTLAEEARLDVELVPATCRCAGCAASFTSSDLIPACPSCGGAAASVTGCILELVALEVVAPCASTAAAI
jgi:hydrogenase nickel incorporation protein HypA/HybF